MSGLLIRAWVYFTRFSVCHPLQLHSVLVYIRDWLRMSVCPINVLDRLHHVWNLVFSNPPPTESYDNTTLSVL